jgi:anti-anti-sigma factor
VTLIESFEDIPSRGPPRPVGDEPDPTVVWLVGEHDASTVSELSATLARAIALEDTDLVVDLTGVPFMDGSTLRVLLRAEEFLARRQRSLTLRAPGSCARLVLGSCGLAALIEPAPVGGALASWVDIPTTDLVAPGATDPVAAPASRCPEGA